MISIPEVWDLWHTEWQESFDIGSTATLATALQVDSIQSDALFILLVEKDAAFMRLAEDRFYNTYPCIILTAKGQPDVASR